jgi:cation:H+ antiporter
VIPVLLIVVGLVGLIFASRVAVDGARGLALRFGQSPMTVGLTIAAVGTSLPEMATNIAAALSAAPGHGSGIAVGNIVGSCLSQITLLLGVTAMVGTLRMPWGDVRRDGAAALGALMIMAIVVADGVAARWEGGILVACYVGYLVHVWRRGGSATTATPT